ncbi:YIP1 family protein [Tropicimonas aquimaris]|uniref:YIP1 family protein n=1 Tax=Tropicimonas aquimaris TaxID=914152 RepID=A0ABW3IRI1_9RHOB
MSVSAEILRTFRAPRQVMRRLLASLSGDDRPEARILVYLVAGCFVIFVSHLPAAVAGGPQWPPEAPAEARVINTFFGWLFIAPLLFYGLAGIVHLVARAIGGRGSFLRSRAALFWTVLAVSPLMLLRGIVQHLIGPGAQLQTMEWVVALAFCALWAISLVEAETAPAG